VKLLLLLFIFTLNSFTHAQSWNKVIENVRVVSIDSKFNLIWTATYNNGVFFYNKNTKKWRSFTQGNGYFVTNGMNDILIAAGKVWVASNYGIYYCDINGTNWQHYVLPGGYFPNWVRTIADDDNVVWFGTFSGLAVYTKATGTFSTFNITKNNNSLTNNIKSIAVGNNEVWFGSEDGVQKYTKGMNIADDASRLLYNKQNGFDNLSQTISVNSIALQDSTVWFGLEDYTPSSNPNYCLGGLYRFKDGNQWTRFDQNSGLTGNGIHFIKMKSDTLIAGLYSYIDGVNFTGKGMLNLNTIDSTITIQNYSGLGVGSTNYFDIIELEDGLWLGAGDGLYTTADSILPFYPDTPPVKPVEFFVRAISPTSIEVSVKPVQYAENYEAHLSNDGTIFPDIVILHNNKDTIHGLIPGELYFVKMAASNNSGVSNTTEVLAVVTGSENSALIVNGFDRTSGVVNPGNYIIRHAVSMYNAGFRFNSTSNEALFNGSLSLENYKTVNWFLGNESIANQTFNSVEQDIAKSFLNGGGFLFVSGSEIGYELFQNGTAVSKDFYMNYLKANYIKDAAGGQNGCYSAVPTDAGIFNGLPAFAFDNGNHGTYNVSYPDGILPNGGSVLCAEFENVDPFTNGGAGVQYAGLFPNGTKPGKLVHLSIPFETIYPLSARNSLMNKIAGFFDITSSVKEKTIPQNFVLEQNYPNPFNPVTTIKYSIPALTPSLSLGERVSEGRVRVTLKIYDILGNEVATLVNDSKAPGFYEVQFDANKYGLASGIYFYKLSAGDFTSTKKFVLMK
jgi:hypothetical protein